MKEHRSKPASRKPFRTNVTIVNLLLVFYLFVSCGVVLGATSSFYAGNVRGLVWAEDSKILFVGFDRHVAWYNTSDKRVVNQSDRQTGRLSFDEESLEWKVDDNSETKSKGEARPSPILYSHGGSLNTFAIDVDNSVVVSSGRDGRLKIGKIRNIDSDNPGLIHSFSRDLASFKFTNAVAISNNGELIASGDCQGYIKLIGIDGGDIWKDRQNDKCINSVAFDNLNTMLVSAGDDGRIRIFDILTGKQIANKKVHGKGVSKILFSPSYDEIITAGKDGKVKRWAFPSLNKIEEYSDHKRAISDIAVTPDGRVVASAGSGNEIVLRDFTGNRLIGRIDVGRTRVTALSISPDGRKLAWAGSDKNIHISSLYDFDIYAAVNSKPCNLITSVVFDDSETFDPNNVLNASESEAYLTTTTVNEGEGPAFGVRVKVSCDNDDIVLEKTTEEIGTLYAGQSSTLRWPLSVKVKAKTGEADFSIITNEIQKRNARPISLPLHVAELVPSAFELVAVEWNDGRTGQAHGNNNKIPENDETIELSFFVKNVGPGRSQEAIAEISFQTAPGLRVIKGRDVLGEIKPGVTQPAKFIFELSKNFRAPKLIYDFEVNDYRDVPGLVSKNNEKVVRHNTPLLAVDINTPSMVTNGESYKLSIIPKNIGSLSASGVSVNVSFKGDIIAYGTKQDVGIVDPGKTGGERTVTFEIPRDYAGSSIVANLSISQELGFSGLDTIIVIPLKSRIPKLEIEAVLNVANNTVVQGQNVTMTLIVANRGDIDASGVKVQIGVNRRHVSVIPSMREIGGILANSAAEQIPVSISVPGGEDLGSMTITIDALQDEFPGMEKKLDIEIVKQESIVIKTPEIVANNPNIAVSSSLPQTQGSIGGVMLSIYPEVNDTTVNEGIFHFQAFSLFSPIGIASFDVSVNGSNRYDHTDQQAQYFLKQSQYQQVSISDLDLPLELGRNIIKIQSRESQTNKITTKEFAVTYVPVSSKLTVKDSRGREVFSDIDIEIENLGSGESRKNRCAIVIGVEKYLNASTSIYSRHDAEVFAAYAEHVFGVPQDNIFTFYDEQASNYNLKEMLEDGSQISLFLERNKGNSEILFYYSGHGIPIPPATDGDEPSSFILPYDVAPTHNDVRKGGLSVDKILQKLQSHSPKMLVVAFDACFMGKSRDGEQLADERPVRLMKTVTLEGAGELSLYATSSDETAIPFAEKYHGLFTYFMLKGLRGFADEEGNSDNKITVGELSNYLKRYVPEYASRYSSKQTPQVTGGDPDMVLVELK